MVVSSEIDMSFTAVTKEALLSLSRLDRTTSWLTLREPVGEAMSKLPLLEVRRGGGGGGGDIKLEVDGDERADNERLRAGGGGGDFRLEVRESANREPSTGGDIGVLELLWLTPGLLVGGGGGAILRGDVGVSVITSVWIGLFSFSSFRDLFDVCVLLLDREGGVLLGRNWLDRRARGGAGGIRRGEVGSETSNGWSNDRRGDAASLSISVDAILEGLGGGGRGLFKSDLDGVGDAGEASDIVIGRV